MTNIGEVVRVDLGERAYDVVIGAGLYERLSQYLSPILKRPKVFVVADKGAWAAQGARLLAGLEAANIGHELIEIAPGEASKSFATLEDLCGQLLRLGPGRKDFLLAFGGGVVGDLVGFAAAILMRGKTAINHPFGKNMIGAFWQPSLVLADTDALASLPTRDILAGWAEVVKYGLIDDGPFFDWCALNAENVRAKDTAALTHAIATSVRAKARIVAADETEQGVRALLNLGHTFAHALENAAQYDEKLLRHGEAVACGMGLAAKYSARVGLLPQQAAQNVVQMLTASGLFGELSSLPDALRQRLNATDLVAAMDGDKKNELGRLTLILMRAIGGAFIETNADRADVLAFLGDELAAIG